MRDTKTPKLNPPLESDDLIIYIIGKQDSSNIGAWTNIKFKQ